MAVDELDRILDRDDVPLLLPVDAVDHRRERRRLTGTRRSGDENEAARLVGEVRHHARESKLLERADLERDLSNDQRNASTLLEAVAAETREVLDAEREVQLVLDLELLLLVLRQHRIGELHAVLRLQHDVDIRVRNVAVDTYLGPPAGGEEQVGGATAGHSL